MTPPVKTRSPRSVNGDKQDTRLAIITAARGLFLQNGYDGTPVSHIARAAGVTTPAVYWHFESKEALYAVVIESGYREFFEELAARTVGGTAAAQLHSYVRAFVDIQLRDIDLAMQYGFHQLRSHLSAQNRRAIDELPRANLEFLKHILLEARREANLSAKDATVTALAITTMCEYVFTWFRPQGKLSPAEVGEIYADTAMRMAGLPGWSDPSGARDETMSGRGSSKSVAQLKAATR